MKPGDDRMDAGTLDTHGTLVSVIVWPTLVLCLLFLVRSLSWSTIRRVMSSPATLALLLLSVTAFLCTWYFMISMVAYDMSLSGHSFQTFFHWLTTKKAHRSQSLIFEAYQRVTDTSHHWYISHQLLAFTASFAFFAGFESRASKAILFLVFAFFVAVSAAVPLFFISLLLSVSFGSNNLISTHHNRSHKQEKKDDVDHVPEGLKMGLSVLSILFYFGMLLLMVHSEGRLYNGLLIAGHVLLLLVPLFGSMTSATYRSLIYALLAMISASMYVLQTTTLYVRYEGWMPAMRAVYEHAFTPYAMGSVSCDWLFCTLTVALWMLLDGGFLWGGLWALVLTPIMGVASAFPAYCAMREVLRGDVIQGLENHNHHPNRSDATKKRD